MLCFLLFRDGPTAGYAGSDASGDTSSAVRRSAQEPTEEPGKTSEAPQESSPFRDRRLSIEELVSSSKAFKIIASSNSPRLKEPSTDEICAPHTSPGPHT